MIVPLVLDPLGHDVFRLPKEIVLQAAAIITTGLLVPALVFRPPTTWPFRRTTFLWIIAVTVFWSGVSTVLSTNYVLSLDTYVYVLSAAVIATSTYVAAADRSLTPMMFVAATVIPAVINGVVVVLQDLRIWNPIAYVEAMFGHRAAVTGLSGNANDVGMTIVVPFVVAITAAIAYPRHRKIATVGALIILVALGSTRTLTAVIAAFGGAAMIFSVRWGRRNVMLALTILVVATIGVVAVTAPLRTRIRSTAALIQARRINEALSGRLIAWGVAVRMFADHPIAGVGPGAYKFNYFDTKTRIQHAHPSLVDEDTRSVNFGEAHSDHLQVLAETGIVGYFIFLGVNGIVFWTAYTARRNTEDAMFARIVGMAAPVTLLMVAVALFPLELAAPRVIAICAYSALLRWTER